MDLTSGNGSVTFILQMDVVGDLIEAREWIAVRSSKTVFENNEEELYGLVVSERRQSESILIEVFEDDAAKIRWKICLPALSPQMAGRFTLTNMLVCGEVKTDLIELLEPMDPVHEFCSRIPEIKSRECFQKFCRVSQKFHDEKHLSSIMEDHYCLCAYKFWCGAAI